MSRYRYDAGQKLEAVRRVVEDGRSVVDVAGEMGVSEGSVFFWVRRYRQFAAAARTAQPSAGASRVLPGVNREHAMPQGVGSLVAYLRRASAA